MPYEQLVIRYFCQILHHVHATFQTDFVNEALRRMTPNQHSYVYSHLKAILQRDFITLLPKKGLDHVAEKILCYLDANSLCAAELVCTGWLRVISEGMLWKKLIERKVQTDLLWKGLAGDNLNLSTVSKHLKKIQLFMKLL